MSGNSSLKSFPLYLFQLPLETIDLSANVFISAKDIKVLTGNKVPQTFSFLESPKFKSVCLCDTKLHDTDIWKELSDQLSKMSKK